MSNANGAYTDFMSSYIFVGMILLPRFLPVLSVCQTIRQLGRSSGGVYEVDGQHQIAHPDEVAVMQHVGLFRL